MMLLTTVTLVSLVVVGSLAWFVPATAKPEPASPPAQLADSTLVRVVGTPFVPNTNPHQRH